MEIILEKYFNPNKAEKKYTIESEDTKARYEYNDIYNYRNSRHFIETVKQARKFEKVSKKKLVIFAGACQSYFEALISAGANFASSPARILIDFLDPLIVAKNVAETERILETVTVQGETI